MRFFRYDGLNDPFSPNCGGATWSLVKRRCEECDAVEAYDWDGAELVVTWTNGNESRYSDPQDALIEIGQASAV